MSESFENNAKRSEKRLRFDLIPIEALEAYAERATIGAEKYGDFNWQKGGPSFFQDAKNHLYYHLLCYLNGRLDDEKAITDHLKAVIWNAGSLLWWELTGKNKYVPPQESREV